jgi:lysozyme family protein
VLKINDNVTQLDLEKFKGECTKQVQSAIEKAIDAAKCANGVAKLQTDKDQMATQKQIDSLFKIVWWLIGVIVVESIGFGLSMLYLVLTLAMKTS